MDVGAANRWVLCFGARGPFACCQTLQPCRFKQINEAKEDEFLTLVLCFKILCAWKARLGYFLGVTDPHLCKSLCPSEGSEMFGCKLSPRSKKQELLHPQLGCRTKADPADLSSQGSPPSLPAALGCHPWTRSAQELQKKSSLPG